MKCPYCKRKTDDTNFCSWCGAPLPEETYAQEESISRGSRRAIFVIGAFIIIGLGVAMIAVWSLSNAPKLVEPSPMSNPANPPIQRSTQSYAESKPSAPSNLNAQALSSHVVQLNWFDNSNNEKGFRVYRNYQIIANLLPGTSSYRDNNLDWANTYTYIVAAFNGAGESRVGPLSVKTLNPSVRLVLEKIGVYFDHDPGLRGAGDIYLGVVVTDGNVIQEYTLPSEGTYSLNDNEYISVGKNIFSADHIGEYLRFFVTSYESDGGNSEQLLYEALGLATSQYTGGISLGSLLSSLFGGNDDFVGSYEKVWNKNIGWGAGHYNDVKCGDLRLWYSIYVE